MGGMTQIVSLLILTMVVYKSQPPLLEEYISNIGTTTYTTDARESAST